jgi:hypothetical protein
VNLAGLTCCLEFVKEARIAKETRDARSVWDLAFSADPGAM